ncbi:MAG: metallophosphoesterase family protein [Flavobacteriaceae bacterium]|nr:metallophosphoesterase family protein [Flavobacteriaceae bacterium]
MYTSFVKFSFIVAIFFFALACKKKPKEEKTNKVHTHHGMAHTHYTAHQKLDGHKLIFPSKTPDRIIANLTEDPAHSFAINWRTNQQIKKGILQIAIATDGPEFALDNIREILAKTQSFQNQNRHEPMVKANFHAVLVDSLQPNTTYAYRVGNGVVEQNELWSEWFQFTTAKTADSKDPFHFIYFGDAQNNIKSMWSRVIRSSYKKLPEVDFMLHAGDLINDRDANLEWGEWFYAGSFIHATVPSMMTPGNHEYRNDSLTVLWKPQFNLPQNGPTPSVSETCYAIDYQNMKLVSIDAPALDPNHEDGHAQVQWLDSVLANNTKKWTALTLHYPIFSTVKDRDNKSLREAIKPLIDKYKVDIVLQGHDHTYARGAVANTPQGATNVDAVGTIYTVSVSGPKMYQSKDQEWMKRRGEFTQLFQILSVGQDTLSYKAYTPIGSLYDAFDLVKKNGRKTLIEVSETIPERFKNNVLK